MWRNRFYTSSPIFPGIGMIYIIHINMKGFKASPELTLLNLSSDVKSRYLSKILQNLAADWHLQRGLLTSFLSMSLFFSHSFYPSFLLWFDSFNTLETYISGYFFNVSMHTHDTRCKELLWKLQSSQSLPSTYQVEVTTYFTVCHTEVYYFRCWKYCQCSLFRCSLHWASTTSRSLSLSHSTQCWTRIPRRKNQASQK